MKQDSDCSKGNSDGKKFLRDSPVVTPADVHGASPIPPSRRPLAGNGCWVPVRDWFVCFRHGSSSDLPFKLPYVCRNQNFSNSQAQPASCSMCRTFAWKGWTKRSEEHTSELQSPCNLVC